MIWMGRGDVLRYVGEVERGEVDGKQTPIVVKETSATACVDGRNALGMVVGQFCMKLAISKAKEAGVGWVVAHGSNHYGIAGTSSILLPLILKRLLCKDITR